jgi:hypothetical protein
VVKAGDREHPPGLESHPGQDGSGVPDDREVPKAGDVRPDERHYPNPLDP